MSRLSSLTALAIAALLVLWTPLGLSGQSAQQFRASADLVAVDVLATDGSGQPVTDLRAADLRLKVDGRAREIRQLDFVNVTRTSTESSPALPRLPLPFGSNDGVNAGRLVLIIIDEEHIRPGEGKPTFDAAGRFLDRLAPADRVALLTLPTGGVRVDATANHDRVRRALALLVGKAPRISSQWKISLAEAMGILEEQTDSDHPKTAEMQSRECKFAPADSSCHTAVLQEALRIAREEERATRATLLAMKDLMTGLSRIDEPKTVVLISAALVSGREFLNDLNDVTRAVALARAQLYVLQPHQAIFDVSFRDTSASAVDDERLMGSGLADLAAGTGGQLFRLSAAGDNAFRQIADEISSFYLLGFRPEAAERDGKQHKIELASIRRNITLRARPMFAINAPAAGATPPDARALVRESSTHPDLALRAAAFQFRDADRSSLKIVVAVETVDPLDTLTSAAFALIDPQGRIVSAWEEDGAAVVVRPLVTAAAIPPGEYKLRVGAVDTRGRRGAVEYEFPGLLTTAGPFQVNSPMFGTTEQGAFRPRLQTEAGATEVTAYMELYAAGPMERKVLSVTFEIASGHDAPALVSTRARVLGTKDADRWVASAVVPIAVLAAGDYSGRAVLTLDGKEIGRVFRTVRKGR
jgi:VWFA-related protein